MNLEPLQALGITREDIINKAVEKLLNSYEEQDMLEIVQKTIREHISKNAASTINAALEKVTSEILDSPYTPIDNWGEPTGRQTTLREMVKTVSLGWLDQKVTKEGKTDRYDKPWTRGEWLAYTAAEKAFNYEYKKEIEDTVIKAKEQIRTQVAKYVAEIILKRP